MAYLSKAKISTTGNVNTGIDVILESGINFLQTDIDLGIEYYAQAFIYDVDYGSDLILPLIENLYCNIDADQIEDRTDGRDDLIATKKFGRFEPKNGNQILKYVFNLQKHPRNSGLLVSDKTLKALSDEAANSAELELKGLIVLTNSVNGIAIARSNQISVAVLTRVIL
jgi:hypothetical protein